MSKPRRKNVKQEVIDFFESKPKRAYAIEDVSKELQLSVQWARILLKDLAKAGKLEKIKQPMKTANFRLVFRRKN